MPLKLRRGSDTDTDRFFKILIFGDSGQGKTWLAASGDRTLVILTEPNGEQSVRRSNPNADVALVENAADLRDTFTALVLGTLRHSDGEKYRTIAIDGLTEIQRLIKDEMTDGGKIDMSIGMWGDLTDRMRNTLRWIRNLPYDVVCTALSETETEEIGGKQVATSYPMFQGSKLPNETMQFFNAAAFVYRDVVTSGARGSGPVTATSRYRAVFESDGRLRVKPCDPLVGVQEGPISRWFGVLRGEIAPTGSGALNLRGAAVPEEGDPLPQTPAAPTRSRGSAPVPEAPPQTSGASTTPTRSRGSAPVPEAPSSDTPPPDPSTRAQGRGDGRGEGAPGAGAQRGRGGRPSAMPPESWQSIGEEPPHAFGDLAPHEVIGEPGDR